MSVLTIDALIIGSGPVGLFSVFQLGLLDIKAHLIDTLDKPGGQCAQLYPEKPIYDIPGFPVLTAQNLVDNLLAQIKPFNPAFHLGQTVASLERADNDLFRVTTKQGKVFETRVLIIATGGGNFEPKKPPLPNIEAFENTSVFYSIQKREVLANKRVVIAGGGDSSLDWILNIFPIAQRVTMIHRRREFRGHAHTANQVKELINTGKIDFVLGQMTALEGEAGQLTHVVVKNESGEEVRLEADILLPFFGLTMKPTPITNFGFEMSQNLICVNTENFETSIPRVFAIGDINTYPGKLKLILSGFHEAALMAQKVAKYIFPEKKPIFQYTTSSSMLQKRLGVKV